MLQPRENGEKRTCEIGCRAEIGYREDERVGLTGSAKLADRNKADGKIEWCRADMTPPR